MMSFKPSICNSCKGFGVGPYYSKGEGERVREIGEREGQRESKKSVCVCGPYLAHPTHQTTTKTNF